MFIFLNGILHILSRWPSKLKVFLLVLIILKLKVAKSQNMFAQSQRLAMHEVTHIFAPFCNIFLQFLQYISPIHNLFFVLKTNLTQSLTWQVSQLVSDWYKCIYRHTAFWLRCHFNIFGAASGWRIFRFYIVRAILSPAGSMHKQKYDNVKWFYQEHPFHHIERQRPEFLSFIQKELFKDD